MYHHNNVNINLYSAPWKLQFINQDSTAIYGMVIELTAKQRNEVAEVLPGNVSVKPSYQLTVVTIVDCFSSRVRG